MPEVARGDATVFGLASLLHLLEGEGVTGTLRYGPGSVSVRLGQPVDARVRKLSGAPAIFELFVRSGETFVVETGDAPEARPLGDLSMLILEGCRLQDEWARLGGLTLVVVQTAALAPSLAPLAPFLDGSRTVSGALDAARLDRASAIDPLLDALERGAVVETAPRPPPAPVASPDELYDASMDRARRCVREGRYDEAVTHFHAALAARPDDRVAQQNLRRLAAIHGTS